MDVWNYKDCGAPENVSVSFRRPDGTLAGYNFAWPQFCKWFWDMPLKMNGDVELPLKISHKSIMDLMLNQSEKIIEGNDNG